jgi:phage terminase large subunit-like protein
MTMAATALQTDTVRDYVAVCNQYARDVVAGKIPNCKWVRLACQRHLDNLKTYGVWTPGQRGKPKGDFYFDPVDAAKICEFAEQLPHVKGKWAKKHELIFLQPWQCFIFCVLFGWKRTKTGKRRFKFAYIKIPRKNGKSIVAAIIGLYMLTMDDEHGPEVFSGATSEKQAWEVFRPAKMMFDSEEAEELRELCDGDSWAKCLYTGDGGRFEPIIGKPGDGSSPSCAIADEFHEHDTPDQVDTMETGMGAREQPLSLKITTAGVNHAGPCYETELDAQKVLEGSLVNDELFAIMYGIDLPETEDEKDKGDDWTDPAVLPKANPNYGVSVDADFLIGQQRQAMQSAEKQTRFKTKHLNVWCGAKSAWMPMALWKLCADTKRKEGSFAGQKAIFGIDLASKDDIACFGKLFYLDIDVNVGGKIQRQRHYWAFNKYYVPEDALHNEDNVNRFKYQAWHAQGHLTTTPGAEIDFGVIREDVKADRSRFQCEFLVYDPWRATQLAHEFKQEGVETVEVRNIYQHMSQPMKETLAAVRGNRFHHDDNPITNWMASNVKAKRDNKDNVQPEKENPKSPLKIDGATVIIMEMNRAMVDTGEGTIDDWLRGGSVVATKGGGH